jgi:hypothetical protein
MGKITFGILMGYINSLPKHVAQESILLNTDSCSASIQHHMMGALHWNAWLITLFLDTF